MKDRRFPGSSSGWFFAGILLSGFFLLTAFSGSAVLSVFFFFLIPAAVCFRNPSSLRFAGGIKFWIFPSVFIFALPFLGSPDAEFLSFPYSSVRASASVLMWAHFYVFNCLVNFFSDNFSMGDFLYFFEKWKMRNAGIRFSLVLCAFKKIKYEAEEIFYFYRSARPGPAGFVSGLPDLVYVFIRNSLKTAEQITELFLIRNVKL